jgi:MinD-like ATPase involved in chromosome partitioning or flagellar assembly
MAEIISIHSYRGGTGKSNIAANVAAILAKSGKRVAVIDTDIQSPGIHILFDFDVRGVEYHLNDYLRDTVALAEVVYDVSYVLKASTSEAGRLWLLPCSVKAGDIANILKHGYDANRLNDSYVEVIKDFDLDYLIVDTHPGLNEETLISISVSDTVVLVLRPDKQDYQGTAVTLEIARQLEVPNLKLIVNKVSEVLDFEDLRRRLEGTYQTAIAGMIPHSDELMLLESGGIFAMEYPDHAITHRLQETVQGITTHQP